MKLPALLSRLAVACVFAGTGMQAIAVPIAYQFTAEIFSISEVDGATGEFRPEVPSTTYPGAFAQLGDRFTGTFFYDSNAPLNSSGNTATNRSYTGTGPGYGFTFANHANTLVHDSQQYRNSGMFISVYDQAPGPDFLQFRSYSILDSGMEIYAGVFFSNADGSGMPGLDIPTEVNLSDYSYSSFSMSWEQMPNGNTVGLEARFVSLGALPLQEVPEPLGWMMFLTTAALATAAARRTPQRSSGVPA